MQTQNITYEALFAEDKALRANASANQNKRDRSAHQSALAGRLLSGYARLAVVAVLIGLVASAAWGLS